MAASQLAPLANPKIRVETLPRTRSFGLRGRIAAVISILRVGWHQRAEAALPSGQRQRAAVEGHSTHSPSCPYAPTPVRWMRNANRETTVPTEKTVSLSLDDRGRATLGSHLPQGVRHVLVTELSGGSLLIEPAEVVSTAEAAFRRDETAMAEVAHALGHREEAVKVDLADRRRRRQAQSRA